MPFSLHVPLPGPFSYSRRLGGRSRSTGHGPAFWVLVGWWWYPIAWVMWGLWLIMKYTAVGTVALARWVTGATTP